MPNTFSLIAASTVGSGGVTSIDFSSIPSTYTDLCLRVSLRASVSATQGYLNINFNNVGYAATSRYIQADGSSAISDTNVSGYAGIINGSTATANTFGTADLYIPNYAGSTNISFSVDGGMENNATLSYLNLMALIWSSTAAINRITIKPAGTQTFVEYSTAYLYGVKNA